MGRIEAPQYIIISVYQYMLKYISTFLKIQKIVMMPKMIQMIYRL